MRAFEPPVRELMRWIERKRLSRTSTMSLTKRLKSLDVNLLDLMNLALLEYRDDDVQYAALALRWSDLDVGKKTLKVERALEYTKKFGLRFKGPKHDRNKSKIKIKEQLL